MKNLQHVFIALVLILLTITLLSYLVSAQEPSDLEVIVIDNDGKPRPGIEVIVANETFRRSFKTGANGVAVFKLLSPGKYDLSVILDGIRVGYSEVDFPTMRRVELKLQIGALRCRIIDVDGNGVGALSVTVKSESGAIKKTGKTSDDGTLVINDLPFSSLPGIGRYQIYAMINNLTVVSEFVDYPVVQTEPLNIVANLARLNFRVNDASGDPVQQGKITLIADNYSASLQIKNGEAPAGEIPISKIAGTYTVNLILNYPEFGKELVILSDKFLLDSSINKTYVLNIDKLVINVASDDGSPVRNLRIILQTDKYGNLTMSTTGRDGKAIFSILPYSIGQYGAGNYRALILKEKNLISSFSFSFTPAVSSIDYTVPRREVSLVVLKPSGEPLPNAIVKIQDPITGLSSEVMTNDEGVAKVKIFPGRHTYSITYLDEVIDSGEVNILEEKLRLTVRGIDINLTIKVLDWLGAPIENIEVAAYKAGQKLLITRTGKGEYSFMVPSRGMITIDLIYDGKIVERRRLIVTQPGMEIIRLRGISIGGGLVSIDTFVMLIAVLFFLSILISSAVLILKRTRGALHGKKYTTSVKSFQV